MPASYEDRMSIGAYGIICWLPSIYGKHIVQRANGGAGQRSICSFANPARDRNGGSCRFRAGAQKSKQAYTELPESARSLTEHGYISSLEPVQVTWFAPAPQSANRCAGRCQLEMSAP